MFDFENHVEGMVGCGWCTREALGVVVVNCIDADVVDMCVVCVVVDDCDGAVHPHCIWARMPMSMLSPTSLLILVLTMLVGRC